MKVEIELVVTDLDNTLYDWVTFFACAFYEMIRVASRHLEVPEERLLDECRMVHHQHRDSEVPFGLLETPSVKKRYGALSRPEQAKALNEAFHAFNHERDRVLKLYPGVYETLEYLHQVVRVVGHTEARAANAVFRLHKLGISGLINPLYALEQSGTEHPDPVRVLQYMRYIDENVRLLPESERKPNPGVLLDICNDEGISPRRALYIGDSIARDIGMAKAAGVWSAWAEYGTRYDRKLWERLVRVTHWTAEDVARAEAAEAKHHYVKPDVVLNQDFSEILDHFSFVGHDREGSDGSCGH